MSTTPTFKNVFILSTGRCGSTGLARACEHIENYTAGHETRAKMSGEERLAYPDFHIESDNRLSWFLGQLDERYGDDAFYVHLIRDREETAVSYNRRWGRHSIMRAFAWGIHMREPLGLPDALDYYDAVNSNIRLFLQNKSHQMMIRMEELEDVFPEFCSAIGAQCDLNEALSTWETKHNPSVLRENVAPMRLDKRIKSHVRKTSRFLKHARTYYKIS